MKRIISLLLVVMMCLCFAGCAREEMDSDELTAKRIIKQAKDGITQIEYVNFLEEADNGYNEYYYYDVITEDGEKYVVELREAGKNKEFSLKRSYKSKSHRKEVLKDLIEYRCSEYGSMRDSWKD